LEGALVEGIARKHFAIAAIDGEINSLLRQ
jgi:hypothetical protein